MNEPEQTFPGAGDYERIATAIAWIDRHAVDQPTSADIAAAAGLSEAHFARMFRRWAGIAPGRYLKHRTQLAAAAALERGASVFDAALDSGLSGPGRLHDLFVTIEAMSPGEYKSGGSGLTLQYGSATTPFGTAFVLTSPRGIVELGFTDATGAETAQHTARERWYGAEFVPLRRTADLLQRVFSRDSGPLPLNPAGTNFQIQVWRALLRVPPGETSYYGDVAADIGRPSAARAVGNAIGANPVAFLIPCHRVLRSGGALGGYRWGPERKQTMLAWEQCQALTTHTNDPCIQRHGSR